MARTLGGVLCLIIATVCHGDDGGDWRDGVTFIASERLRGEVVDWFRLRPGAADPGPNRYGFVASQLRAGLSVTLPRAQLTDGVTGPARIGPSRRCAGKAWGW